MKKLLMISLALGMFTFAACDKDDDKKDDSKNQPATDSTQVNPGDNPGGEEDYRVPTIAELNTDPIVDKNEVTIGNITFVYVQGGTFYMGSKDDIRKAHKVTVSDFYMAKYPLTQAQWNYFSQYNPSRFVGDNNPVDQLSWNRAQEFISAVNYASIIQVRMPTEAEWEYAARGGRKSQNYLYSGSNNLDEVGWYYLNSGDEIPTPTHPVGQKQPNELGLYDMSGNISEMCSDWYAPYPTEEQINPTGPASQVGTDGKVARGGYCSGNETVCTVFARMANQVTDNYSLTGVRLVIPANQINN